MLRKSYFLIVSLFLLIAGLGLSGCGLVRVSFVTGTAPTPVVGFEKGGVDNPDVFVDPEAFENALIQALNVHDTGRLQMWMTEPFLTGALGADLSDSAPADALKMFYAEQFSEKNPLALVKGADLKALMGGKNPLSIPRPEAGVTHVILVSGWGKDARDEAILFIARQADNSLKWHGWMQIQGGFSGARLGGIKQYSNEAQGFSVYLPKDYLVSEVTPGQIDVMAPGVGHPGDTRAAAFIFVEPANGRTAQQIVEATKAELGPGFNIPIPTIMGIDSGPAIVVSGLPGQDPNRQLFMVHGDTLYRIMFIPDVPQAEAYSAMEDVYAMMVNTWHFTKDAP